MTMEYWWYTETELVRLQQCLVIHTVTVELQHDSNLRRYQVSGNGVQYRTSFVHAHCVCTWLLTITCIIMHRHCLSQTTNMTHAPLIVVHFSFSNLSITKREPNFVGVRSRRPVEHAGEMRLFLDPSDHWLPFNRYLMA